MAHPFTLLHRARLAGARPRHPNARLAPGLLIGSALAAASLACGEGPAQQAPVQPPAPVTVGAVVRKAMPLTVRAIGHVDPISTVAVRARVGGQLDRVWFTEGQNVTQGQRLFSIDAAPYEASLREAEARLARDQALLKKAEIDATRYADLVKQDYVTKEQFDQIIANGASLRAQAEADRASVETARLQVSYCTIAAPISGRTGNLMVKAGNLVRPNDVPMVTINQIRPIFVSFPVPARHLPAIQARRGQALRVAAQVPDTSQPEERGTLSFLDNTVDQGSNTVLLKATFENAGERLWPGQFVDVVLTLGEEPDRVVAPAPAVQTGQLGQYVFVVSEDGVAEQRPVKVNRIDAADAVIDDGLTGGETVITDGHLRVVPGGKVAVQGAVAPAGQDTKKATPGGAAARQP